MPFIVWMVNDFIEAKQLLLSAFISQSFCVYVLVFIDLSESNKV